MAWTGWTHVPAPNAPGNRPPPAGLDVESDDEPEDIRLTKGWTPQPQSRRNRSQEFIERDLIERVLADNVGQELKWLEDLLGDGVRVLNDTGRFIKSDPFVARIRKQRKSAVK